MFSPLVTTVLLVLVCASEMNATDHENARGSISARPAHSGGGARRAHNPLQRLVILPPVTPPLVVPPVTHPPGPIPQPTCCIPHQYPYVKFGRRSITDYLKLDGALPIDLTAITLCLFLRQDSDVSGTMHVFSYATPGDWMGNTFLLKTVPSIRIFLARDVVATDYTIDDGNWHQMCFTWRSHDGAWQLFDNGNRVGYGNRLAPREVITGGGTVVLGQDQDRVGGGFDADQAFLGEISEVNMWHRVLSASEILAQRQNCHIADGSLIRWPQFILPHAIHGGARKICG